MKFRGVKYLTIDDKGRFAMPAKYREALFESCGGRLVVTVGTDGCLLVYPQPVWEEKQEEIQELPNADPRVRRFQRVVIGYATDCDMSKQGRVSLTSSLREIGKLDREIALVGQTDKFEIWDANRWREFASDFDFDFAGEALQGFSL